MTDQRFDDEPLAMIRRVGRDALVTRMIELFLRSAPARADAIRQGYASGDLVTAGRSAHSLKSSAGQLGAIRLQALCQQLEDAGKAGDADAVGILLPDLSTELAAAIDWLRSTGSANTPPSPQ